jgi:phosphoglycolate phosphatase-like HAD superfamily hydrolase
LTAGRFFRLTATRPDRMLLVGDSAIDVATAANAGVDFCGVGWGFDPAALRRVQPRWIVESAGELTAFAAGDQSVRDGRASTASYNAR